MTPSPENIIAKKQNQAKTISWIFYTGLLLQIVYWSVTRQSGFSLALLLLQTAPLLALLPGMIKAYYRTYSWLCFVLLIYFVFAVMGALKSTAQFEDYLFLVTVVSLFISAMFASRWMQRVQKQIYH